MKKFVLLLVFFILYGCNEKKITMIHYQLKNGDGIELEYSIGSALGATTPDVTWIKKIKKNGDGYLVGKIKAVFDHDRINIFQINDTIIKIRFTDTTMWKGQFRDYIVNINKRIELNDNSSYIE